ncbi:MAG TPA: hypothetical protein VIH46_12820 [Candidatus Acidoferrales bacterium]
MIANGPRRNETERFRFKRVILHAPPEYLDGIKPKLSCDLRQECAFPGVRLDQRNVEAGRDDSERQSWKASTRANVGEPTFLMIHLGRCKNALAEVKFEYFAGLCHGGERNRPIPMQKNRDVRADLFSRNVTQRHAVWTQRGFDL